MKIIIWLLSIFFSLILFISGCIIFFSTTQPGLTVMIKIVEKFVPGELYVGKNSGSLDKHLQLSQIIYRNREINLKINQLDLLWQPQQLFSGKLIIKQLFLSSLEIEQLQAESTEPSSSSQKISMNSWFPISFQKTSMNSWLPIEINVENFAANHIIINHYPLADFNGSLLFTHDQHNYFLNSLRLSAGDNYLQARGALTDKLQAYWTVHIPHLNLLMPNSQGQITSDGEIENSNKINARLTAQNIKYHAYAIQNIDLKLVGSLIHHQITMNYQQTDNNFKLRTNGSWQNNLWTGNIKELTLNSTKAGNWYLQQPTSLQISSRFINIKPSIWRSPNGYVELSGAWQSPQSWSFVAHAKQADFSLIQAWLGQNLQIKAPFSVNINAAQRGPDISQWSSNITVMPGSVLYKTANKTQKINFQGGSLYTVLSDQQGLLSQFNFAVNSTQYLKGIAQLPGYKNFEDSLLTQPIKGTAQINITDLSTLPIQAQLQQIKGSLTVNTQVSGTIKQPVINGTLILDNASMHIKPLNIDLQQIRLTAQGNNTGNILINGIISSGKGQVKIQGTAQTTPGFPAQLFINGNQFTVMNTKEYQIAVSPNLTLRKQNDQLQLTGKITVPQASIMPIDFSQKTITVPNDVVFINQKQPASSSFPWQITSNIEFVLGNAININIQGLSGQVTGSVLVHDSPQRFTTATGILNIINGKYNAYGQELAIDFGRLIFNEQPVTDPGLAIRATRQITVLNNMNAINNPNNFANLGPSNSASNLPSLFTQQGILTVGVNVNGTLQNPQTTLFSEPANLSQADILSYLMLGHPADQISPGDAKIILQAATGLNMSGGQLEQIQRELQNLFGLDTLNIQSTNYIDPNAGLKQNTSLVLGKKLSPKLMISYSVGLLQPVNIFTLRYLLSSRWTFQSTSSTFATGADLFYTLEKN